MNQIQYTTAKKHCLFVMLPENPTKIKLIDGVNFECWSNNLNHYVKLPQRDWKIEGFVSNLTDEQKEGVVPNVDVTGYGKLFPNYLDDEGNLFMDVGQSFETIVESLGIEQTDNYILLICNKK